MAITPEETLADEGRRRIPAAAAGIGAGLLTLLASVLAISSDRDLPNVAVIRALREHLSLGASPKLGLKAQEVLYRNDHALELLGTALALALSAVAIGIALSYLYRAAYARRPAIGRVTIIVIIAGAVLSALPIIVSAIAQTFEASSFASATDQSAKAARDVLGAPVVLAALYLGELGRLLMGLSFVLASLKAMSVGLLTRFMGILGVIVGVLFILPIGTKLPFVQIFWLVGLGALFLGKSVGQQGMPPAWSTGEAVPWPTQQQLREARLARQQERGGGGTAAKPFGRSALATREKAPTVTSNGKGRGRPSLPETPAPAAPKRPAHSSSKKKKRKRR